MWNRRRTLQTGLATLLVRRRSAARLFAAEAAREGPLQRGRALDPCMRRPMSRSPRASSRSAGLDVTLATAQGGDKSMAIMLSQPGRHRADRPGVGDLRSEQRFAGQDSDLLRPHRHRRLHAGRAREGRQVRLEHAQGQGDPRLPPRQHAAAVSRGGAAPERARSAEGREAHEQRRRSRRAWAPGSRARTSTPSSSSRMPRSSSSTARRISWPRSARPSASPTTPPSWRRDKYIKEQPETLQTWTDAIAKAMTWTAQAPIPELVKALEPFFPGVNPEGDGRGRRTLPPAQDLEDLAGHRAGGRSRSSRTSWCRATCSSRASA